MILCPQRYSAHLLILITFGGNPKPPVVEKSKSKKGKGDQKELNILHGINSKALLAFIGRKVKLNPHC
jgi:hypothetical protein